MIRVAVITDIHGDLDALQQVLAAIGSAGINKIWCVGDIIGLGATAPSEVVDVVRDRCAVTLAGNHDRWVTGQLSLSMLPLPRQRAELQSQNHGLSDEQLAWLAALPGHTRDQDVEMWHGSAQDPFVGTFPGLREQDATNSAHASRTSHLATRGRPPESSSSSVHMMLARVSELPEGVRGSASAV